jgi:hypothetical protein
MKDSELLELCNEYLNYNPETGSICWIKKAAKNTFIGVPITTIDGRGYLKLRLDNKIYYQHRIAFLMYHGFLPRNIDHINHKKADNCIDNLRGCTHRQNNANQKIRSTNTSGYKGVHKVGSKWACQIRVEGKKHWLGYFFCKHEAARAYNEKSLELYGEFAYLNEVNNG